MQEILVSTQWLAENLNNEKLVLLDASMATVIGREPVVYDAPLFIPNSQQLEIEGALCNGDSPQVHAFPTEEQFTHEAQRLGISSDSIVVIYDNQGVYSAPRGWWIFQAMGMKNAFILDGGLPKWRAENRPVESVLKTTPVAKGNLVGVYDEQLVCDANYVLGNISNESKQLFDARSKERFLGIAPEPRAGVRGGHIPNSCSLPFAQVLDGDCVKTPAELSTVFADLVKTPAQQLIFSCGSGITACIILMAARIAGYDNTVLYDGSWSDWGSNDSLPIE